jgi:uncharacterized SAM-dependent methyltransferase
LVRATAPKPQRCFRCCIRQYAPVDISREFLLGAVTQLQQRFPHIEMTALGLDFSGGFTLAGQRARGAPGVFLSRLLDRQFHAGAGGKFLRGLRANRGSDGGLLIGVDLIKDHEVLDAACTTIRWG